MRILTIAVAGWMLVALQITTVPASAHGSEGVVDFMAAAEGFMRVVAISAAVAVMGGMAVGIEVAGMGAAGTEAVRIGMVVLPIGGGIIHTLTGLTVGKS